MGAAGPGLVGSVGCCLFALVIAPAYAQMFSDFDNPVPALTKLMLVGIGGFIFCLAAMWLPDLAQLQAVPSDGVDG